MMKLPSLACSLVLAVGSVAVSRADSPAGEAGGSELESLADRQAVIRDRVQRLEDRMYQLSQALKKSDPGKSSRLLDGLGNLRGKSVRDKIEKIVQELNDKQYSDAMDGQKVVSQDLKDLLRLLLEDATDLEDRKREIERLEALKQALNKIIKEQETEHAAAQAAREAEERAAALEAAAEKVEDLLQRQKDVNSATAKPGADLSTGAAKQAEIRGETEAVKRAVESMLEDEAEKATNDEAAEGDSSGQAGGGSDMDPAKAAEALKGATEKMERAEKQLRKGESEEAGADQQGAAEDLEEALENLREEARKLRNKLQLEKQAEQQRETAENTRKLGQDMKGAGEKGGQAGQPGGQPQDGESGGGEDTPGQQNVEQAAPLQEEAADELEEEDLDEAIEKQEDAIEKLKQAQEELEDRLDQLRKEQQEELLAALEARFRAMLGRQLECNKATNRLAELGPENWKRSDQLELAELSEKQRWVSEQAGDAHFLLVEEGTTVVLPQLVEQVRDDARDTAERLAAADTGPTVLFMQEELEQVLRDILEAIKKKQEELEEGGGGGGGGNAPLLPGSAELKLLRACQLRVNKATVMLESERVDPALDKGEVTKRLNRLAARQESVTEMCTEMQDSLKQSQ